MVLVAGAAAGALAMFGLPPIDVHSPLHYVGIMDPLCGMTRAARLMALAKFGDAVAYNPGIVVLVSGAVMALARWVVGALSGRWLVFVLANRRAVVRLVVVAAVGALWLNQRLHAALLIDR